MKLSNNKLLRSWIVPPTYVYDIIREQYLDYIPWLLVRSVQYIGKVPGHRECSGNVPMLPGHKSFKHVMPVLARAPNSTEATDPKPVMCKVEPRYRQTLIPDKKARVKCRVSAALNFSPLPATAPSFPLYTYAVTQQ